MSSFSPSSKSRSGLHIPPRGSGGCKWILPFFGVLSVYSSSAQDCEPDAGCGFSTLAGYGVVQVTASPVFVPIDMIRSPGARAFFLVLSGETYEWSNREADGGVSPFDTELTLFHSPDTNPACYGNDPDGNGAFIGWTAPIYGSVYVGLNKVPCSSDTTDCTVLWRCASCPELPEIRIPYVGSNEVACGTNVRLQDPGGNDYYPNNANGYTVLHVSGSGSIRIRGTHAIENFFDQLTLYAGTTGTGTVLATYTNAGFIDFLGQPGQPISARFRSDANGSMAGFDLQVTYEGQCAEVGITESDQLEWSVHPNPSSGRFTVQCSTPEQIRNIDLLDIQGKVLRTWEPQWHSDATYPISMEDEVAPGCYFLRLQTPHGSRAQRIMLE